MLHPAEQTLRSVADAFARRDQVAIEALIADGWSGTRFLSNWDEHEWQKASAALRTATIQSEAIDRRVYLVADGDRKRNIEVVLINGQWLLDYNSFRGPFPHP